VKGERIEMGSWRRFAVGAGLVFLFFLVQLGCAAQDSQRDIVLRPYDFTYQSYAQLLLHHVHEGLVDYAGLKQERDLLDTLVTDLGHADLAGVTSNQRLAFYCNSYNILTLRSVVDAYPVSSIKDIDGVWDEQTWLVAGKKLTLNEIEHEVLRKEFREPRIHVAINCASIGCPPLLNVPYYPDRLDSLLTVAARRFASSEAHNRIDLEKKMARLSAIFDWFGEDFIDAYHVSGKYPDLDRKQGAALNFLVSHLSENATGASGAGFSVEYLDYDWALNDLNR
jgi:hypothetical protein